MCTLVACEQGANEDKFLGTWVSSSGGTTIMYTFKKDTDGTYSASCSTSQSYGTPKVYLFEKYTASGKVVTFYQNGKQTKNYYSFEGGYLYLDNLEFEKWK